MSGGNGVRAVLRFSDAAKNSAESPSSAPPGGKRLGPRVKKEAGMKKISVIDSHTGGEPTRLIVAGGP
ncbi:MAG: hypothetical protein FJ288_19665, partial [Planctomycetes bacterium]|nr:hypothetical protein [Planctomycetota bacterium]